MLENVRAYDQVKDPIKLLESCLDGAIDHAVEDGRGLSRTDVVNLNPHDLLGAVTAVPGGICPAAAADIKHPAMLASDPVEKT